jgi:hypothetical protein
MVIHQPAHPAAASVPAARRRFPLLAILFAWFALKCWTLLPEPSAVLADPELWLNTLWRVAIIALAAAAAVGLWRGEPWVVRVMVTGYTLFMAYLAIDPLRAEGAAGLASVETWVTLAVAGLVFSSPILYVNGSLNPGVPLRALLPDIRWR